MTEEQIKQKAEEYASEDNICICGEDYLLHKDLVEAYIAGATEWNKELTELYEKVREDRDMWAKKSKELQEENERLKKIEEEYFDFLQKKSEEDWKGDNIVGCLNLRIEQKDKQIEKMKSDSKTAYIKGIRTMANALKKYDREEGAWTDYFEHSVDKVLKNLLKEFGE